MCVESPQQVTSRLYESAVSVEHQICVVEREAVLGTGGVRVRRARLLLDVVGHDVHLVIPGQAAQVPHHLR